MAKIQWKLFVVAVGFSLMLSACAKQPAETSLYSSEEFGESKILNVSGWKDNQLELLVKLESDSDEGADVELSVDGIASVRKALESTPGKEALEKRFGLNRWYVCLIDESSDIRTVANKIAANPKVRAVEYGRRFSKSSDCIGVACNDFLAQTKTGTTPFNDPLLASQWSYRNIGDIKVAVDCCEGADINVSDVWTGLTGGDESIIVAVIDEGVKYTHPDLVGNIWTGPNGEHGKNFVNPSEGINWDKSGDSGHGTHCAGTIAAVNNNSLGVCGVAGGTGKGDGVKIMSCQIFSGENGGSSSAIANAIKYAADNGASVISCSFGYRGANYGSDNEFLAGNNGTNTLVADAIHYFEASCNNDVLDGNIAIFSSGNSTLNYAEYPGAMADIICVSSIGPDFLPTYYTNYGPGCNITAPGGEAYHLSSSGNISTAAQILSTLPSEIYGSDYGYMQGTSMACPHVSGIAALGLAYARKLGKKFSVAQFKNMLLTSVNDIDSRIKGQKTLQYGKSFNLTPYYHQMGTGAIDAWRFLMQIEGIPCLTAETGRKQWLDLSDYFGSASVSLTYLSVDVDDASRESLGLVEDPEIKYGRLYIHPTKTGAGKIRISAVGGGSELGGGNNPPGGMEISQEVSIISRSFKSSNGGWL